MMKNLLSDIQLGPQLTGPTTPLSNGGGGAAGAGILFQSVISKIIAVMTVVAFIWFTFQIVIGAIGIISSGGDKGAVEKARKQITTGIVGVVMVVAAIFLVALIGMILGIPNILNPICVINNNC